MGCVHTHWKILAIEGWGNPNRIRSILEKIREVSWTFRKIGRTINQTPARRSEHDRIQAWLMSEIPSKNMLEKVWWCKCSKMESLNRTIYCPMSCSNKGRHMEARGGRKSHVSLKCWWKRKVLLSIRAKSSKRKGYWSTIKLVTMIEATKAKFPK